LLLVFGATIGVLVIVAIVVIGRDFLIVMGFSGHPDEAWQAD
jgi:hypothetical protein